MPPILHPLAFVVAAALLAPPALAGGGGPYTHPATRADLAGLWRVVELPPELKTGLAKDPWPEPCQFIAFYPNQQFLHQQRRGGACANGLPPAPPALPIEIEWDVPQPGTLDVNEITTARTQHWKADRVDRDAHLDQTNLNPGDLVVQLQGADGKFIYRRLLRPVSAQ